MRNPNLGALRAVPAGYDAGHFNLLGEVIAARDRLTMLERLHSANQVSPAAPAAHRAAALALRRPGGAKGIRKGGRSGRGRGSADPASAVDPGRSRRRCRIGRGRGCL